MSATSASVERLFSVDGQVATAKRARLDPSTVTLLVFLHEAIPGGIDGREAYEIIKQFSVSSLASPLFRDRGPDWWERG